MFPLPILIGVGICIAVFLILLIFVVYQECREKGLKKGAFNILSGFSNVMFTGMASVDKRKYQLDPQAKSEIDMNLNFLKWGIIAVVAFFGFMLLVGVVLAMYQYGDFNTAVTEFFNFISEQFKE